MKFSNTTHNNMQIDSGTNYNNNYSVIGGKNMELRRLIIIIIKILNKYSAHGDYFVHFHRTVIIIWTTRER